MEEFPDLIKKPVKHLVDQPKELFDINGNEIIIDPKLGTDRHRKYKIGDILAVKEDGEISREDLSPDLQEYMKKLRTAGKKYEVIGFGTYGTKVILSIDGGQFLSEGCGGAELIFSITNRLELFPKSFYTATGRSLLSTGHDTLGAYKIGDEIKLHHKTDSNPPLPEKITVEGFTKDGKIIFKADEYEFGSKKYEVYEAWDMEFLKELEQVIEI